MERSSPLAAMQAPSLHFGDWGFRTNPSISNSHYNGKLYFGPSSFNFKDLSMVKPTPEYFSLRPVRGSSPTASLAADLSQNFHIDQRWAPCRGPEEPLLTACSPQLATPRRSLFSTNLLGTLNGRGRVLTLRWCGYSSHNDRDRDHSTGTIVFTGPGERLDGYLSAAP